MWKDQVCVVTGGANGIGAALCRRLAALGAAVVVGDRDRARGAAVAAECRGVFHEVDVADERSIRTLVEAAVARAGRVDAFFSNAGIHYGVEAMGLGLAAHSAAQWERIWRINVQSHVFAIQTLLPHFRAQGGGRFLITASAAGLLNDISDASYGTTKHAAVGLAESIAMTHASDGVQVSCLCPQAVDTDMGRLGGDPKSNMAAADGVLTPEHVADVTLQAMERGDFMILPHEVVHKYFMGKAKDYNRWIKGMIKVRSRYLSAKL